MGLGLSRPQYNYIDRVRPTEYVKSYAPCSCGTTYCRERRRDGYRNPNEMMSEMLLGTGYGQPSMGMGCGVSPLYGSRAVLSGMPYGSAPGVIVNANQSRSPTNSNWPGGWKDPGEWTVRDFNRLGEIMDEYLTRQRGREMGAVQHRAPHGRGLRREEAWDSSYMDMPFHRQEFSRADLEQLQAQMMKYVEESRQQMQAVSDFLYGSERERREELYKERQRKMIEDIVRNLHGSNRGYDSPLSPFRAEGSRTPPLHEGTRGNIPHGMVPPGYNGGTRMNMMGGMHPYAMSMGMDPMGIGLGRGQREQDPS